jgi:putative pyruvate formate lyase activating enzyme
VACCFSHFGEEDCLTGQGGSGTIFFTSCSLRCVFCQNADISQQETGDEVTPVQLARMMLALQEKGCHNINFVTPTHLVTADSYPELNRRVCREEMQQARQFARDAGLHRWL